MIPDKRFVSGEEIVKTVWGDTSGQRQGTVKPVVTRHEMML